MVVRPREATLEYARKMHYRNVMWLDADGQIELLTLAAGQQRTLSLDEVLGEKFTL